MRLLWSLALIAVPLVGFANAPEQSLFPKYRPVAATVSLPVSPFPKQRPSALNTTVAKAVKISTKGSVCGRRLIKGQSLPRIQGPIRGCGIKAPVKLTSVAGVSLRPAATVDCTTAKALEKWLTGAVQPAFANKGGVTQIRVAASYSCRTRNNKKGAKLSEHSFGNAIDISSFTLTGGQVVTVLKGWRSKSYGPALKRVHKKACGTFGTVLGPNSDRYHQDHFHFDTARYRSGAYCR